jgi:hypothetical protein
MSELTSDLVSPCCGAEYTDNKDGLSYCCDDIISEEGVCMKCFEHSEPEEGNVCTKCFDVFEDPISEHEYDKKEEESYIENRRDGEKDES